MKQNEKTLSEIQIMANLWKKCGSLVVLFLAPFGHIDTVSARLKVLSLDAQLSSTLVY